MNVFPEMARAGADDWLFILFVLFGITAQVIEANRKKKLAAKKNPAGPRPLPSGPPASPPEAKAPQEELEAFLKALGVQQESAAVKSAAASPAPPERPKRQRPPEPQTQRRFIKPAPAPKQATAEQKFRQRYSGASSAQQAATPMNLMPDNEGVNRMLQQSRSLITNIPGIRMPTPPLGPRNSTGLKPNSSFDLNLKNRNELRRAILNQEILGKPKAMEPYR